MTTMRAVLLTTLHRRYHELKENLARARDRAVAELGYAPDVVLVWARPEVCRLWFINELVEQGLVTHVVGRPELPGEGGDRATTYPESHNLRAGLEFIRERYDPATHYAVVLAADVWVKDDTFLFVQNKINDGNKAVLFHWENGCVHDGVWHTNFFAVPLEADYWPPLSLPDDQDVLERQWGRHLQKVQPAGVFKWHNYQQRRFLHTHESEGLETFPERPQHARTGFGLATRGRRVWYLRCWDFVRGVVSWCTSLFRRGA